MIKNQSVRTILAIMMLVSSLVLVACGDNESKMQESKDVAEEVNEKKFENTTSEKDARFVVDAASASFDEIRLADVALAKSTNAHVKQIAQQLKDEHSALITEINAIASKTAITVPAVASDNASKGASSLMDGDLKKFDKNWLQKVKDMHEASIKNFEDASKDVSDVDIKNWANATLVKIKAHLHMITKVQNSIK